MESAVQYLEKHIRDGNAITIVIIELAKSIEKQNIIEARITAPLLPSIDKSIYLNEAEQYYNETFKSE